MNDHLPDNWSIPTLGFLNREPLIFGIPKGQAGPVIMIGFLSFMITTKMVGIVIGAMVFMSVTTLILFITRYLYKSDPHWWEHMTSRAMPMVRYTGK